MVKVTTSGDRQKRLSNIFRKSMFLLFMVTVVNILAYFVYSLLDMPNFTFDEPAGKGFGSMTINISEVFLFISGLAWNLMLLLLLVYIVVHVVKLLTVGLKPKL